MRTAVSLVHCVLARAWVVHVSRTRDVVFFCRAESLAVDTLKHALELTSAQVTAAREELQQAELQHEKELSSAKAAVGRPRAVQTALAAIVPGFFALCVRQPFLGLPVRQPFLLPLGFPVRNRVGYLCGCHVRVL